MVLYMLSFRFRKNSPQTILRAIGTIGHRKAVWMSERIRKIQFRDSRPVWGVQNIMMTITFCEVEGISPTFLGF